VNPRLRKLLLTAHVVLSVGWLGSVAAFLVLSVAALATHDSGVARSAYVAMNLIGEFLIVPLSLGALASGVVQSLSAQWGLARHYWVVVKLVLTIGATVLLLVHQFTAVAAAAGIASTGPWASSPDVGRLGAQLIVDAGLALVVLLVITVLSIFKPWGRTGSAPAGLKVFSAVIGGSVLAVALVRHLATGGMSHHHH
jgi:hypothetical protein